MSPSLWSRTTTRDLTIRDPFTTLMQLGQVLGPTCESCRLTETCTRLLTFFILHLFISQISKKSASHSSTHLQEWPWPLTQSVKSSRRSLIDTGLLSGSCHLQQDPMGFSALFVPFYLCPNLQISLELAFDDTWSDFSFTRFLQGHAKTLHHIGLSDVSHRVPNTRSFHTWITQIASDEAVFGGLESLTTPGLHSTNFNTVMLVIRTSIRNLTKLARVGST
jgi:hypothetical protein